LLALLLVAASATADPPIRPGDHIAIIGNTFADQLRAHGYLETLLLQRFRDDPVSIRNLGWGGDMLSARDRPTGFPSEESTLTAHETDVIIACFGMGESFAGESGLEAFRSQLRSFTSSHVGKIYNGQSQVRLILVSPIAYEDLGRLTPNPDQRNRQLEAYTHAMQEVAAENHVPFVDLFQASRYLMDEPTGPQLTSNGIHLNPYGYWAISHTFCDQLLADASFSSRQSWLLRIDVATMSSDARGVELTELAADQSRLSFQVMEKSAPMVRPPTDQQLPPQLDFVRDTLVVENLQPGNYRLTVDREAVVTAAAEAWSEGVAVDTSPAHKAAEEYRAAINDKNLQFTYSWKALNQVHIVGERRTSPSGKTLPKEVIEFNRLAKERDRALSRGVELRTRNWRLTRVSE